MYFGMECVILFHYFINKDLFICLFDDLIFIFLGKLIQDSNN